MKTKLNSYIKGMTLIELTVVILVLLSLISVLFIGAKAWKDGSDKANCVMNIRNMQTAGRSLANLEAKTGAVVLNDIAKFLNGSESTTLPKCPAAGTYALNGTPAWDAAPGTVFIKCDKTGHAPTTTQSASW